MDEIDLEEVKRLLRENSLMISLVILLFFVLIFRSEIREKAHYLFLAYFLISLIHRLDSRYPIGAGIFLLFFAAISLVRKSESFANQVAIYAYYFLVVGVVLQVIEYVREGGEAEEEKVEEVLEVKKEFRKERRFIAIASGKGGVGKTTIAANLGVVLSKMGKKVAVADMDLAMPDLEILMGLKSPPVGLVDVLEGGLGIKKVIYEGPEGVRVIPSGVVLEGFTDENVEKIRSALKKIPEEMEFVILDMPPGREAVKVLEKGHEVLLVVNPEVTSVADALNMKVLAEGRGATIIGAVLNRVEGEKGELSIEEIEKAIDLQVISTMPEDRRIKEALSYEIPFVLKYPNSRACTEINSLAAWLILGKEGGIKSL